MNGSAGDGGPIICHVDVFALYQIEHLFQVARSSFQAAWHQAKHIAFNGQLKVSATPSFGFVPKRFDPTVPSRK